MKSIIQFSFKELEPKKQESLLLPLEETTVKIHELKLGVWKIVGEYISQTYSDEKGSSFKFVYLGKKLNNILCTIKIDDVVFITICYNPKVK